VTIFSAVNVNAVNVSADSTLSVLYFNANDLRNKINELFTITNTYNPDVLCITETFATSNYNDLFFHLPGYFLLRQDRIVRGGGGIILYIRNGLSYQLDSSVAHSSGLWEAIVCTIFFSCFHPYEGGLFLSFTWSDDFILP